MRGADESIGACRHVCPEDPIVGLIETMRAVDGRVLFLDAHIDRVMRSRAYLHLESAPSRQSVTQALGAVCAGISIRDARVRLVIGARGYLHACATPVEPVPEQPDQVRAITVRGAWLPDASWREHKTTDRALWIWGERRAGASRVDAALMCDADGNLGESTRASVCVVVAGRVLTAPCAGLLPGVGRAFVRTVRADLIETMIAPSLWSDAEEIFLVSALRGVRSVTELDGRAVGSGAVGEVAQQVHDAYRALR
jgi:branched-subunit amino acid aminotransferase/4-amino-4-deoxychorismate lyase